MREAGTRGVAECPSSQALLSMLPKVSASLLGDGQLAQCHQEAGRECPCARLLSIVRQVVVSSSSEQLPVVHPSHLL